MSGRLYIFRDAWQLIKGAPFIGYGPQADRRVLTIVGNAQNAILYALLCGGFLGGSGYIAGLASSPGYFWCGRCATAICCSPMNRSLCCKSPAF